MGENGVGFDSSTLRTFPTMWPVGGFNIERMVPAFIDGLVTQKLFTPWDQNTAAPAPSGSPKIGLVYMDIPFHAKHNVDFQRALARHGFKVAETFGVRADSNYQADIQAAVLRFASNRVTHVIFNQDGSTFGFFALNASKQRYYPRYGVTTLDFPEIVKQNVPDHRVFNGLKGVGWAPFSDIDTPPPHDAGEKECLKIYRDKGIDAADSNEETLQLIECDVFFNFVRPASIAGRGLNVSSFLGAIQRLGRQPSNAYS
ncbi:MAG: hypothetical protein ACRDKJ_03695, partial [Actinomycetota bacterium]